MLFSVVLLLRLVRSPRDFIGVVEDPPSPDGSGDGSVLGYLAFWPTAWLGLVALAAVDAGGAAPGEENMSYALVVYGGWWAGAAWALATLLVVLGRLISRPRLGRRTVGGRFARPVAVVVAGMGVAMAALAGGVVVERLVPGRAISVGLAAPVLVFCFVSAGCALLAAAGADAVLLHELLLVTGWPPPENATAVFYPVGPPALTAAAFRFLGGGVVKSVQELGKDGPGSLPTDIGVEALNVVCLLLSLLLTGMATVWLLLAIVGLVYRVSHGEAEWSPSWNGAALPLGALALITSRFASDFSSRFFGIVTCILLVACVLALLLNVGFALRETIKKATSPKPMGTKTN